MTIVRNRSHPIQFLTALFFIIYMFTFTKMWNIFQYIERYSADSMTIFIHRIYA